MALAMKTSVVFGNKVAAPRASRTSAVRPVAAIRDDVARCDGQGNQEGWVVLLVRNRGSCSFSVCLSCVARVSRVETRKAASSYWSGALVQAEKFIQGRPHPEKVVDIEPLQSTLPYVRPSSGS
jgi:hypothetical protein